MPNAIETMKRKRQCHQHLDPALHKLIPIAHSFSHFRGRQIPAQGRGNQVGETEDVESAAE